MASKNKQATVWFILALVWVFALLYFTLSPSPPQIGGLWGWDKLQHAAALGILAFFVTSWCLASNKNQTPSFIIGFVVSVAFGILIELLQKVLTVNRKADVNDIIADAFGAFIVVLFMFLFSRTRKT